MFWLNRVVVLLLLISSLEIPAIGVGPSGLIAYYSFNQGTASDDSGNGYHGEIHGATISKKALQFNGQEQYVTIPRKIEDDFSIVFLVKTDQPAASTAQWWGGKGLVDAETCDVVNDFGVSLLGSKAAMGIGNPDTTIISEKSINDNEWHQIAAVRTKASGEMKLYVDTDPKVTGNGNMESLNIPAKIGIGNSPCNIDANINWFKGMIDEVRIYNRALSDKEVADLYAIAIPTSLDFFAGEFKDNGHIRVTVRTNPLPSIKALEAKFYYRDPNNPTKSVRLPPQKQNMQFWDNDRTPQYIFEFDQYVPEDVKEVKLELYWYDGKKWSLIEDPEWGSTHTLRK